MKKNRFVNPKKMSVNAKLSMHGFAALAFVVIAIALNRFAASSCEQLSRTIGERQKEMARLENDRCREMANWEAMKTPDKVEAALLRHGLAMRAPSAEQNVHMKVDGQPYLGQYSVAAARRRNGGRAAKAR